MTPMTTIPIAAVLAALLATAAGADGRVDRAFAMADENGDGRITRAELRDCKEAQFRRADLNHDGFVDAAELDAIRRLVRLARAAAETRIDAAMRLDRDGDAKISLEEFAGRLPMFDLADADGDGAVTMAEIDRLKAIFGR